MPDGQTAQLVATVYDQNQQTMTSLPAGVSVAWSSDAASVASVSGGTVSALHPGSAHVSADLLKDGGVISRSQTTVTVQQVASTMVVTGTPVTTATVGNTLTSVLAVKVIDRHGDPVAGIPVTFQVTKPAVPGSVTPTSAVTDANGIAKSNWTLSTTSGLNAATATSGSMSATFQVNGVAGPATKLTIVSGSGQLAAVGTRVMNPLVVKVSDQYGNGVQGFNVVWTVTQGTDATIQTPTRATDADGITSGINFNLGPNEEVAKVTAGGGGLAAVTFDARGVFPNRVRIFDAAGTRDVTDQTLSVAMATQVVDVIAKVFDAANEEIPGVCITWNQGSNTIMDLAAPNDDCATNGGFWSSHANRGGPARSPSARGGSGRRLSVRGSAQGSEKLTAQASIPVYPYDAWSAQVGINVLDPVSKVLISTSSRSRLGPSDTVVVHVGESVTMFAEAFDGSNQLLPATWAGGARRFTWTTASGETTIVAILSFGTGQGQSNTVVARAAGVDVVRAITTTQSSRVDTIGSVAIKVLP